MARHTIPMLVPCALVLSLGCGGGGAEVEPPQDDGDSSGGEIAAGTTAPIVMRTTTPVPVPQPAVARENLSADLQSLWDVIEAAVAIRPPEPPTAGTIEEVQQWSEGPFAEWMRSRMAAVHAAEEAAGFVDGAAPMERAVAAALFGYLYEDTAASVRGAPVPDAIAADEELLMVYADTLTDALEPVAVQSVQAYAACATSLAQLGDPAWSEWIQYCADRGREVATVFEVAAHVSEPAADSEQP